MNCTKVVVFPDQRLLSFFRRGWSAAWQDGCQSGDGAGQDWRGHDQVAGGAPGARPDRPDEPLGAGVGEQDWRAHGRVAGRALRARPARVAEPLGAAAGEAGVGEQHQ